MASAARPRRIWKSLGIAASAAALIGTAVTVVGAGTSYAISDGHYRFWKNHCKGSDLNSNRPNYVNPQCTALIFTISDYGGHEYFGAGIPEAPNNKEPSTIDFWADPGQGQDLSWSLTPGGHISGVTISPSKQAKADPASGLRLYFGADDNLDVGEHDSSPYTNNGPSDGGAINVNISPTVAVAWIAALQAANLPRLLTHPVPVEGGSGFGECADGFCSSFATSRTIAFRGWNKSIHRDAADYVWSNGKPVQWKPYNCSGQADPVSDGRSGTNVCDTPALHKKLGRHNSCYNKNGYMTIACWNQLSGAVYDEPGFQIYEDPDPQASPGVISLVVPSQVYNGNDPYPWPTLYVGSCGVVIGGGPKNLPTHLTVPGSNAAGQYVYKTGCN
jgi:hypothetical protein